MNDEISELENEKNLKHVKEKSFIVIDRLKHSLNDEDYNSRIGDSAQTAFYEGFGDCIIYQIDSKKKTSFWIPLSVHP